MRLQDIKIGETYHNGKGLTRTVIEFTDPRFEKDPIFCPSNIVYIDGKGRKASCWCTTFANWAKGRVGDDVKLPFEATAPEQQLLNAIREANIQPQQVLKGLISYAETASDNPIDVRQRDALRKYLKENE